MKRLISLALAGAMTVTLLTGCGGSDTPAGGSASGGSSGSGSSKHTLAASIPLTGNLMQYGISYQNALKMAVDDFNAAGGLNGEDVILEINDDKGDQKEAINLANKIVEEKDVFAVVGSFGSSVSMAAAPVYQRASMPMVSPNTSHPDYPGMGDMMVPISPVADIERTALAEMLYQNFDGKDLAIMHQNTDLGVTGADILKKEYESLGGKVVIVENFVPQQTKDFTPIISKIKAANPGILYLDGEYNDIANILIQIDNIGLDGVQIAGPGNAFKQEFLDIAGDKANGIVLVGTTPVYLDSIVNGENDFSETLIDFTNRYNELYPDTPCDGFAAAAYDSAMLAMTAAKNAGTDDPHALVKAMLECPIEATSGRDMHYEGNNVIKGVYAYTVENGEFKTYISK
ncbi:MAG: ABC transporter substrate-binding protein [Butyricicoccus pullicaecorum]|nr:ABC transporter substrate-binding protein [Butyricicoccus pullicaecorum]